MLVGVMIIWVVGWMNRHLICGWVWSRSYELAWSGTDRNFRTRRSSKVGSENVNNTVKDMNENEHNANEPCQWFEFGACDFFNHPGHNEDS